MTQFEILEKENRELRRSVDELILLNDLARTISSLGNSEEIIQNIIQRSLRAVNGEQGVVTLIDKDSNDIMRTHIRTMTVTREHKPIHLQQFLLGWIEKNRIPLLINNPATDERFPHADWDETTRSILCVPLMVKSELIGVLTIYNKKGADGFREDDMRLLSILASQSAQIIENARLFEKEQAMKIEQLKLQQEILFHEVEEKRLRELSEMKSFFVSSVSHELKTPLTSIVIFTEMLQLQENITQHQQGYLEIIIREADRLTRLINDVLDFTKSEYKVKEYNFSKVHLHDILNSVLRTMEYQFRMNKVDVHMQLAEQDFILEADADAVTQAVINLLTNAMKYSDEKKRISVSTFTSDSFVCIRVDDTGIGISKENIEQIFNPFYRVDQKLQGGAGIGLTLVQNIMKAHNGRIDVKSTLGEGSSFTLLFPLVDS